MKHLSIVFCFLIIFQNVWSQDYYPRESLVNTVKKAPLIIELRSIKEKKLKRWQKKKPEKTKQLLENIDAFNYNLEHAVKKVWKFNESYTFMNRQELSDFEAESVFSVLLVKEYDLYSNSNVNSTLEKGYALELKLAGKFNPVYKVSIPSVYPTEAELIFALQFIQNGLEKVYKEGEVTRNLFSQRFVPIQAEKSILENTTLFVNEYMVPEHIVTENFKRMYPFEFNLCDPEIIEEKIINQDTDFTYIYSTPFKGEEENIGDDNPIDGTVIYQHYLVNGSDGKVINVIETAIPGVNRKVIESLLNDFPKR